MTRLRKANRNKGWEKRHHAKQLSELHLTIAKMEQHAIGLANAILQERAMVNEKAYEFASNMLKMRHLKEVLDRISYEFSQADQRNLREWMERNYEFCFKHGINDISDAAEYIEYNRNQRRAREQSARFAIDVDQQRKFKRIRLSFPALTYEMTVDDV
jgi:hypothetical protein